MHAIVERRGALEQLTFAHKFITIAYAYICTMKVLEGLCNSKPTSRAAWSEDDVDVPVREHVECDARTVLG